ncbi:MAG: DUF721 domain-containing protein [Gammaproteobacteria bacterium]|nr:DUF721 domain-containing protein [Gammaproteobacteria bacterium]NIR82258.1 DUF721 domain-containing protein [Gammaproteobacteria bacterium]NIR91189.1 DUF721 domain-containing protein [Gammaproteobacteria bacterium]NIU03407.1 DUF721 domain-containing protein [Gammaproteobacteria bacterium]NIX84682.1 DUF721 domain-containing protein [Gammaproteobacteria bacterium]
MSRSPFTSVRELVSGTASPLRGLLQHARDLERVDGLVRQHLGTPLNRHCRLANLTPRTVVLHADSPVWSARLRYRTPDILALLRRRLKQPGLREAQVRVRPPAQPAPRPPARPRLSAGTAALLHSVAEGIEDPRLRQALRRLARHRRS